MKSLLATIILLVAMPAFDQEKPMRIVIDTLPPVQQRYDTVGDYQFEYKDGVPQIHITVSQMGNQQYEFLVALHELVEAELVLRRDIPQKAIDDFDMAYEAARKDGDDSEPGDDPKAPYHKEHLFATAIERLMAGELGVDWTAYDAAVEAMP